MAAKIKIIKQMLQKVLTMNRWRLLKSCPQSILLLGFWVLDLGGVVVLDLGSTGSFEVEEVVVSASPMSGLVSSAAVSVIF